jgi:hypothetical protein
MTGALVRDRELHDLVAALDAASETLELLGYSGPDAGYLGISLRESFEVRVAIRQAADFLFALRHDGGGRP